MCVDLHSSQWWLSHDDAAVFPVTANRWQCSDRRHHCAVPAVDNMTELKQTRTTRMPAFWEYPQPPHDYPYYWFISDPKSKQDKVKITNLPKIQFVKNFAKTLNATHLLKQLNKMCKYEMDLASTVEVTERTRFCPQMDGQNDGRTSWNQYAPTSHFQLHWSGGCNNIPSPISLRKFNGHFILLLFNRIWWQYRSTLVELCKQSVLPIDH